MSTIVVGVDGSEGGIAALRYALEEARLRGAAVRVVSAWHAPAAAYEAVWVPAPLDVTQFEAIGTDAAKVSIEAVAAESGGIEITTEVAQGQAGHVLLSAAEGADLLVVGSRGLGGFRGLLLGSVSQQCAHHAPCPVVIVPTGK